MSRDAKELPAGVIEACNVLPAYRTSLAFGATEDELRQHLGWSAEALETNGAYVSGDTTYAHLELMFHKPRYAEFLLAAVTAHQPGSLGVVGFACKTAPTIREALHCHRRFQHLTNRTVVYETLLSPPELILREHREGVPLVGGSPHAELVLADDVLDSATVGADAELAAFFRGLLGPGAPSEPPSTLDRVRSVIADSLLHGAPSLPEVARSLAVSTRTLQRRLAAEQASFSDVLDDVRRERAARYLREPTLSIAEVAYLLGYTEHASFYRAFRRWYDQTPAEFRASVA